MSDTGSHTVGFIGLGAMGAAMAERLLAAKVPLVVFDTNPEALAPFVAGGAEAAGSVAAVGEAAEIVFLCLPKAPVSAAVCRDLASTDRTRIVVEMSTIGKAAIEPMAALLAGHGKVLVDCPISGGPRGARAGTLAIITAGEPDAVEAIRPYLGVIGKNIFVVGEKPGLAQIMKLVNNLMSAANMASAFEALVMGAKAGLDADMMVDVINVSSGRNTATTDKVPQSVLTGSFDFGARLDILYKDIQLGLAEAEALGVPMPTLNAVTQLFRHGAIEGRGPDDFTTLIKTVEGWAGVEVRSRKAPIRS